MSHTPEQAADLKCPIHESLCMSSGCAMWRWVPSGKTERHAGIADGRVFSVDVKVPPTHGYCGLAGRLEVM